MQVAGTAQLGSFRGARLPGRRQTGSPAREPNLSARRGCRRVTERGRLDTHEPDGTRSRIAGTRIALAESGRCLSQAARIVGGGTVRLARRIGLNAAVIDGTGSLEWRLGGFVRRSSAQVDRVETVARFKSQ